MNLRALLLAVASLAAVSAATYLARRQDTSPAADLRVGQPLADSAVVEKMTKLRISDQGKTVTLTRQVDGSWSVENYFNLPANFSKISAFANSLTESKIQRVVTTNTERRERLGFKDTQVVLLDSSDHKLLSVALGKNADTGGRFVRFDAEPKAYLADFIGGIDPEPGDWADTELPTLKPESIAKIEITFFEEKPIYFSRTNRDAAWTTDQTPAARKIGPAKIIALLSLIGNLRFSETNEANDPASTAAKTHVTVFSLTSFEGKTVSVTFSHKPEEKNVIPVVGNDGQPILSAPVPDPVAAPGKKNVSQLREGITSLNGRPLPGEFPIPPNGKSLNLGVNSMPKNPVFIKITHSESAAPINAMMQMRAFQIESSIYSNLPQRSDELFEPIPEPQLEKVIDETPQKPKEN